jgi:Tfp pilus assembly protein PilO
MTTKPSLLSGMRSVKVLAVVGALVLVVILWVALFLVPSGHKINNLNAEKATLSQQQGQLDAKLAVLKQDQAGVPEAKALLSRFGILVPANVNNFQYISQMDVIATKSSVNMSTLQVPSVGTLGSNGIVNIPVQATVVGTYSQILGFIRNVYYPAEINAPGTCTVTPGVTSNVPPTVTNDLPPGSFCAVAGRLTVINSVSLSPGPNSTPPLTSGSPMSASLSMSIFTSDASAVSGATP